MTTRKENRFEKALRIFKDHNGMLRMSHAIKLGIHPDTLYKLLYRGQIEKLSRGIYRISGMPPLSNPDLVSITQRIPNGVICLISALSYYELTTQIPHAIYIAIKRDSEPPRIQYPPLRAFWYPIGNFEQGIIVENMDGVSVRIYCPERTIMDCFKYRNKIGLDVAVEALKLYRERGRMKTELLAEYARMNRVRKVVSPYIEAML